MIDVYIDGASAGDPGISGAGVFINHNNGKTEEYSFPLSMSDNHTAEFMAMIKALQLCIKKGYHTVAVKTDSQIVDQAIEKRHIKNEKYKALLQEILNLEQQFNLLFVKWIPGKQNKNADRLAKRAIQTQTTGDHE